MKELMSIKEFSTMSGIEVTTLRYWDDIGLFNPAERNPNNNYRYYTPTQLISVNFISILSELSVPLKTIDNYGTIRNPDNIMRLLNNHEKKLSLELRELQTKYSIIATRRGLMTFAQNIEDVNALEIMRKEAQAYILGPRNSFEKDEAFYESFSAFCRQSECLHINLRFPIGAYHVDFDSFLKAPGKPDHFFSLDPGGNSSYPSGEYLFGYTIGYYGEFGDLPERMKNYIEENALEVTGPVSTIYLLDELSIADRNKYLACVSVEIKRFKKGKKGKKIRSIMDYS